MVGVERSGAKATAKLGAPRILDAGPGRLSRWKVVDDKAFETIGGYETLMSVPTPTELRATLVTVIAGASETPTGRWEMLIGPVQVLSLALHPRSNWRVEVSGTDDDRRWIDAAIELVRAEHPYVTGRGDPGL